MIRQLLNSGAAPSLGHNPGAKFLPWILGIMIYIACLSAGIAVSVSAETEKWHEDLVSEATLMLPSPLKESAAERKDRLEKILRMLEEDPAIARAHALDKDEIGALVRPWIDEETAKEIDLPDLIALSIKDPATFDGAQLQTRVAAVSPGAMLDNHRAFADDALRFLRTIRYLALALLTLIFSVTIGLTAFAAAANLVTHRSVIEIWSLFGADDRSIAMEIQRYMLRLSAPGILTGTIAAIITLGSGLFWLRANDILRGSSGLFGASALLIPALVLTACLATMLLAIRIVALAELKREG